VRTETVALSAVSRAAADSWRALSEDALVANPYFGYDALVSAHRHLRPDVDPAVILVWDGPDVVGVLPFVEQQHWRRIPVRLKTTAAPLGATVCDLHVPLLAPGRGSSVYTAILTEASSAARGVVLEFPMHADVVEASGALAEAAAAADAVVERWWSGERGAVKGTGGYHAFEGSMVVDETALRGFSTARRKSLRRALHRLSGLGAVEVGDRTNDAGALDDFIRLEAEGWKGDPARGGQGVRTVPGGVEWLCELTRGARARGALAIIEMTIGGEIAWMGIEVRAGSRWFAVRDLYRERFPSAGSLGRAAELEWFRRSGDPPFDSCINPRLHPHAATAYPDGFPVATYVVGMGPAGRAAVRVARSARAAKRRTAALRRHLA
jgi:hypothetical protein